MDTSGHTVGRASATEWTASVHTLPHFKPAMSPLSNCYGMYTVAHTLLCDVTHVQMTFPWIQKNRFDKSNHAQRMWRRFLASTPRFFSKGIPLWRCSQKKMSKVRIFFWAHAVRARGSDGHQNVLSLISYSHMLENRWKQKARCLPIPNKAKTAKNQNPTKNKPKQPKKTPRKLGETLRFQMKSPQAAQYFFTMS